MIFTLKIFLLSVMATGNLQHKQEKNAWKTLNSYEFFFTCDLCIDYDKSEGLVDEDFANVVYVVKYM